MNQMAVKTKEAGSGRVFLATLSLAFLLGLPISSGSAQELDGTASPSPALPSGEVEPGRVPSPPETTPVEVSADGSRNSDEGADAETTSETEVDSEDAAEAARIEAEKAAVADTRTAEEIAAEKAKLAEIAIEAHPLEPANTDSPQATLVSFLRACDEVYEILERNYRTGVVRQRDRIQRYQTRILRHFDLSEETGLSREAAGTEAAVALKEVFDRIGIPPVEEIPSSDDIEPDGSHPGLTRWVMPHSDIVIALQSEGPRRGEWLFTKETVDRAVEFYHLVEDMPYREGASEGIMEWFLNYPGARIRSLVLKLPEPFHQRVGKRHALWQWLGLGLLLLAAMVALLVIYRLARRRGERFKGDRPVRYFLTLWLPVLAMAVPYLTRKIMRQELRITGEVYQVVAFMCGLVGIFTMMIVIIGFGARVAELVISRPKINAKGLDAQFVRIVSKVLSLLAALVVFLEGGQFLGIPLSTLLASAGVGGLALALAAQDSLKNLFGSIMILFDKPFRVGERVFVKGYDGIVDEIGLRSTRLALLNGHYAYIPNEQMATSQIENVGRRKHIRRITDFRLPIDTPPEKTEQALAIIRGALENHEGMEEDFPPRVYFFDYQPDALMLRMIYWYHPPAYWDYLAFSEKLNLRIGRELEDAGIRFALPSTEMRVSQAEGGPPAVLQEVKEEVESAERRPAD